MVEQASTQTLAANPITSFRAGAPQLRVEVDRVQGRDAEGPGRRRVRDAVVLSRLDLRQPLQQVRPQPPGLRPGRFAVPRSARGHPEAPRAEPGRARWCRSARWPTLQPTPGAPLISLYNLYPSAAIVGSPAPGFSSGEAMDADGPDRRARPCRPARATNGRRCPTRRRSSATSSIYRLRAGHPAGLSLPRRPVRELDRAARPSSSRCRWR